MGGDHTIGAPPGQALYTGINTAPGTNDVDGGECRATSPTWPVAGESLLSAWYFHGQPDGTGNDLDDYFYLELSLDDGANWATLVFIRDVTTRAVWTEATTTIPAGSDVKVKAVTCQHLFFLPCAILTA